MTKPFSIAERLFDENAENLGLSEVKGTQTQIIFTAEDSCRYINGVVMTEFCGKLYCQWQASAVDEDSPDTHVLMSVSDDGINWSRPTPLAAATENGYATSGGWHRYENRLVAFINVWKNGGHAYYTETQDGVTWSELKPVLMENGEQLGVIEQDIHTVGSRLICAAHFGEGLFASPVYTDDKSGKSGWVCGKYEPLQTDIAREIEPSLFLNSDNEIIMIFRDQTGSLKKLAAKSKDLGESWGKAVLTDMPDSRSKQSAGNLPDRTAYMVSNPVNSKIRIPLAITLSADGKSFTKACLLRGEDIPPQKFEGKAKRVGYHYPKSTVIGDWLYVSYSVNKEQAAYTRVPIAEISLNRKPLFCQ